MPRFPTHNVAGVERERVVRLRSEVLCPFTVLRTVLQRYVLIDLGQVDLEQSPLALWAQFWTTALQRFDFEAGQVQVGSALFWREEHAIASSEGDIQR